MENTLLNSRVGSNVVFKLATTFENLQSPRAPYYTTLFSHFWTTLAYLAVPLRPWIASCTPLNYVTCREIRVPPELQAQSLCLQTILAAAVKTTSLSSFLDDGTQQLTLFAPSDKYLLSISSIAVFVSHFITLEACRSH